MNKRMTISLTSALSLTSAIALFSFTATADVVVETKSLKLVIGDDAIAKSLVCKATGEECLDVHERIAVFATTQIRPFNNEVRLVQQAKRTTYPANRVWREGELLHVKFETAPYEVTVKVTESDAGYVAFKVEDLISNTTDERQYYRWNLDVPPVDSFRVLQLPVKNRANFGDWLNVMWDDRAVVGVMGGTPYMDVDNEIRDGFRRLTVESLKDYGVRNGTAVLAVAADRETFLDQVDAMERDLGLPRGVQSRRDSRLNASLYWTYDLDPEDVDTVLAYMKQGGFRMLLVYYTALLKDAKTQGYRILPEYVLNDKWTREKLTAALDKFHAAGISVGFHTLQTFIGFKSRYVTPEADHRLALLKHYTLAQPIPLSDSPSEIFVEENPIAAPMHPKCRVLKFGTELFTYEGYTVERPYKFTGVKRSHLDTWAKDHPLGEIGGVLGISECGAVTTYIDQSSSLQDEVAENLAKIYSCGFDFLYFDGSEDANVPCTINISLSQYRCVEACAKATGRYPLFTEGCAKSHFGWHIQSGANAFDIFPPEIFKDRIFRYPCAAAERLAKDFTRVDFGWWRFAPVKRDGEVQLSGWWNGKAKTVGVQTDIWEYGTSKAAAYDCPATMQMSLKEIKRHRRTADILETMRRWEDVRAKKWLTPEQKELLKDPAKEFHLYLNERGEYELLEWKQLKVAGGLWADVRAFMFERGGRRVVAYWHIEDKAELKLADGRGTLAAENLTYWETDLGEDEVRRAFAGAEIR